jgi:hypothetical protein
VAILSGNLRRRVCIQITSLCLLCSASTMSAAHKMGLSSQYDVVKNNAEQAVGRSIYKRIDSDSIRFGDPVHEDMTAASIATAIGESTKLACSPSRAMVDEFVAKPKRTTVRSHMCCSRSADSYWCNQLGSKRYSRFEQRAPLIDGVRWNDDPCHMTLWDDRLRSRIAWAAWMIDSKYLESNNLNYASHFHEKQFLHAMASSGRNDPLPYRERRSETRRKIIAWAEFAFRVSDGSLNASLTLKQAHQALSDSSKKYF